MSRKTVKVKDLVEQINRKNKTSTCDRRVRQGWNALLEDILHTTGNYQGFNYYSDVDLADGLTPGVRTEINKSGVLAPCADYGERFRGTDDSRIFFYFFG
jgi:hypothetical protein